LACCETHLPNAFFLPPYFVLNAVFDSVVLPRSVLHVADAFSVAASCFASFALAYAETHLPNALRSLAFLP